MVEWRGNQYKSPAFGLKSQAIIGEIGSALRVGVTAHRHRDSLEVTDISHGHSVPSSVSLKKHQNPDSMAQNWFTYPCVTPNRQCIEAVWLFQPQPGFLCGRTLTLSLKGIGKCKKWLLENKPLTLWASMEAGVGLSTGAWAASPGSHPQRKLTLFPPAAPSS